MKKIILSLAFILLTGIIFAQTLNKGNILGLRVYDVELQPGVTIEQVENYLAEQSLDFNNNFDDIKLYFIMGLRGENENKLAGIVFMDSDNVRDKYFTDEGVTEAGQVLQENLAKTVTGLEDFVTAESAALFFTNSNYTDWEIQ